MLFLSTRRQLSGINQWWSAENADKKIERHCCVKFSLTCVVRMCYFIMNMQFCIIVWHFLTKLNKWQCNCQKKKPVRFGLNLNILKFGCSTCW